jgi:hypothetical protein
MYARDAAVKFNPIPPQVIVASSTAIPELSRNTRRTLSRPVVDRLPSRRTHRIDLFISTGWSRSKVLVQLEKTTLAKHKINLGKNLDSDSTCSPFRTFCKLTQIFDNSLNLCRQLSRDFSETR